MKNKKALWISIGVFMLLQAIGATLAGWFRLRGWDLFILTGGLVVLGLVAAVLMNLLLRPKSTTPAASRAEDEIDVAIRSARSRLAAARRGDAGKLGTLPLALVLGPSGSTKTTVVVQSGLDPELLAGEVHRNDTVVATEAVNLWYTQELIVVEAGGVLLEEPTRWARLIRHLRPSRWSAALLRRPQAPRMAVVCFPCDAFLQPGGSQSVPAAARTLRTRLAELSRQLGVRLPVYVLFTKADRIPYFEDYVRNFSRDEAQQVLGATLPVTDDAVPGVHAEQESRRLAEAFGGIFRSLALHRLDVLPRESREDVKAGAYEFPREIRKLSDLATQFLLELCKPSQLSVNPFLRGFYFTGVRPVVVSDSAAQAQQPGPAGPQIALGATGVFSLQGMHQQRTPAPAVASGTRRVPEWTFLKRVFREVILPDQVARGITAGGVRVNMLRRALVGAAAAVFVLLSFAFTVSYLNNRALEQDALAAARGVEALDHAEFDAPELGVLQRLDALREQTARVADYERNGRPWRLGWGLYTGHALYPKLRQLYFDRFERLLWAQSRSGLMGSLRALPDTPNETSEYGSVYNSLKAHLITTTHPRESSPEFLTPVLMGHWSSGRGLDEERLDLARRQYDFFAAELPFGNPYRDHADEEIVGQTRGFLFRFADSDRLYQVLLSEAGRAHEPLRFHRVFPGTEAVVRNAYEVPGAFTKQGWASVQASLADIDKLFARERWVVGERNISPADRAKLADELRARYTADYIRRWQEYLRAGSVVTGGGIAEIAKRLESLSGNQTPLMQMLALASQHTAVDTAEVNRAFQPLHQVIPPDMTDRFIGDSNAGYIQALGGLHGALAQAAALSGPARSMAVGQASSNAEQVRSAIRTLAQSFTLDGGARQVGSDVQRLMQAPLSGIDGMITTLPSAEVNEKGQGFCAQLRPVLAKYPFNPSSAVPATVDDVMGAFQPGSSLLWAFYQDALGEMLDRRGLQFGPRVGATPQPSAAFVGFFNRAAGISRAMFDESGAGPEVVFLLRPQATAEIPEITVSMDSRVATFTRTEAAAQSFAWDAARARGIRITGRINGVETTLLEGQGMWGVFQVFQQAAWSGSEGSRHTVRWRLPGQAQPLSAEITFARGVPIFHPEHTSLRCVSQITR